MIASKTTVGGEMVDVKVPADFPGYDGKQTDRVFEENVDGADRAES